MRNRHNHQQTNNIAPLLLEWYIKEHRDLPWRHRQDAYGIWISEVMLQQTQVDTVIDYYNRFMKAFPTIQHLAHADEDQVLKLWEGLGYYSRAKRLKQCALVLVNEYNGEFPQDYKAVLKLPGIGPYTAGAILSIAYNMAVPAVDGNVMRVFARLFNDPRDIGDIKTRKTYEEIARQLLPDNCRDFNQALMELGATVCTPKNPKCTDCPVSHHCEGKLHQRQHLLPKKKKKKKNVQLNMEVAFVKVDHRLLIIKRPADGLLASLWGFPIIPRKENYEKGFSIKEELEDFLGIDLLLKGYVKEAKHVFSHRTWNMSVYEFEAKVMVRPDYPLVKWVKEKELEDYALPTAFKKLIR